VKPQIIYQYPVRRRGKNLGPAGVFQGSLANLFCINSRNEPYRREAASHTSQGWPASQKRSFDNSFTTSSKALEGDQRDKRFNPHSQPKGTGDRTGLMHLFCGSFSRFLKV
jgi:hypothetical protein